MCRNLSLAMQRCELINDLTLAKLCRDRQRRHSPPAPILSH